MKDKIMQEIKEKNIKMKSCYFFCARKAGLQSSLAFLAVASALFLNGIMYFIKKSGALDSLSIGVDGWDNFLAALPYGYIALFLLLILLASYIMHKFDLSYGISMNSNMALVFLLVVVGFLSFFFFINGIEDVFNSWEKSELF